MSLISTYLSIPHVIVHVTSPLSDVLELFFFLLYLILALSEKIIEIKLQLPSEKT